MLNRSTKFAGWKAMATEIQASLPVPQSYLDEGQVAGVKVLANSLLSHGAVLADEVGMGKTRIAVAMALAVKRCGGRVAIVVPPVVAPQWREEFAKAGENTQDMLRSLDGLVGEYQDNGPARMDDPIVILSHRFADLRVQWAGTRWRADLLKLVVKEAVPGLRTGVERAPWCRGDAALTASAVSKAARTCAATRSAIDDIAQQFHKIANRSALDDPNSDRFGNHSVELQLLERCLGLALGPFDFVIVDEAHKTRSEWGKLAALLDRVILRRGAKTRTLGMTATPVELDVWQWKSTLGRVGMDEAVWKSIEPTVLQFRDAAEDVRQRWRTDQQARERYIAASHAFQKSLAPWVVRRDKRRDDIVKRFTAQMGEGADYRQRKMIEVVPECLTERWRRIVFAAEALSVIGQAAADTSATRARLTISNGHGVAGIIDKLAREASSAGQGAEAEAEAGEDARQSIEDGEDNHVAVDSEHYGERKRKQRADFWKRVLRAPFADGDASLHDHPVLARVIEDIEATTARGEKVLVFGRFTRPMRVLTELLNARALLKSVRDGAVWPHAATHDDDQHALMVAADQLSMHYDRASVDAKLSRAYEAFAKGRQAMRDHLEALVDNSEHCTTPKQADLLHAIGHSEHKADSIRLLVRAIEPLVSPTATISSSEVFEAFRVLTDELLKNREGGFDRDVAALWPRLYEGLKAEYQSPRANFARRLYSGTPPATRRLVQLAFNRSASEPHVLVAQSMVGREGLNLHESCRIVILLHLEWNPAVVEQQIGRVDRKNSHWSRLMLQALDADQAEIPRIEIRPVVFRGTYDEHHWSVLARRWDEQRAQLHGQVVSDSDRMGLTDDERIVLQRLEENSPDFWPHYGVDVQGE